MYRLKVPHTTSSEKNGARPTFLNVFTIFALFNRKNNNYEEIIEF